MPASNQAQPSLLAIVWPIFIEQGLRILIGVVDVLMVSHVSDGAAAGLGVANQLIVIFLIVFNFVAIGSSVVITHHLGAKDRAGSDSITTNAIAVNTWLGVIASVAVYFLARPMLRAMELPEELMPYGLPFLTMMGGTLFMEAMNMAIAATLRAHKHTRDAMYVIGGQNILNVIGNCILLFGLFGAPKMGVTGVAISSVFSRCCASVALWILLDRRTRLRLRALDFLRISWGKVRRILHIGLPAAGENLCYWMALMFVTRFSARLGADSLATQIYAQNLQRFIVLFTISIGLGTEILTGYHVGAGRVEEAYRQLLHSLKLGLAVAVVVCLAVAGLGPWALHWFTDNPAIIAGSAVLLRIAIINEPGRVFNVVVINSLRATGDVYFPIQMAAFSMWCVWVPLAWLLALHLGMGVTGIWIAMGVDEWLRGLMMYRRWKQRHWIKAAERSRAKVISEAVAPADGD